VEDPVIDTVSEILAAITARLAARHDGLTILRAVTDACAPVLSADAIGVLVTDPRGGVGVASASDERARFVELLQSQTHEGPCLDSITGNVSLSAPDLDAERDRWPRFVPAATEAGFRSVHAFPLRLMDRAVGGLNVFHNVVTELSSSQLRLAQVLADLAVLGLTQERDERRVERLAEQTLTSLNDRAHIGHAVGVVAGTLGVDVAAARALLSEHSAATGQSARDVARAVTNGTVTPQDLRARNPASGA
jgi:GAF domain-containing protein